VRAVIAVALCFALNLGCATIVAMQIPGPVEDQTVSLGAHRSEVESILRNARRNE